MGRLSHTVSGDIASFRTPSRVPIESLKFHFLPKQAAGTPSPENPIPIEGWTGLNGRRAGKNLIKPYYTEPTTYYGIPITPTANGVRVTGTAAVECAIRLSSMDVRFLDEGKKYTFSLYVNGDISGCKDPYIGYHDGASYWGTMGSLTEANNHKLTWTVPSRYANAVAPWFDMYIRIREGSTVDFEIGLQMEEGSNATDFEPYSEELIPITFPSNGKNIVDWPTPDGFSVAASLFNGWNADWIREPIYVDRSNFGKRIIYSATIDNTNGIRDAALHVWVKDKNEAYVSSGITSEIVPVGSSKRVYAVVPITGASWYKIYLGLTIGSGCVVSNPMAEYSMSMTNYEPYSSDTTFYGGYYDPIAGEIIAEWGKKFLTGNEGWFTYGSLDSSEGISFACPMMDKKLGYKTSKCNMFDNVDGAWGSGHKSEFGIYSDHRTVENIYVRRPNEGISTLNDFKQWLSENSPEIIYELKTPIHIPVAPKDLKAFLGYNNFWSDANDVTEVAYAVTESKDILDARKLIMAGSQPHLEDASGTIASFSTDMKAPLKELKAHFTPVQEGSGDPSLQNERPIHGLTGLLLHHDGKNIIDLQSAIWSGDSNKVSYSISGGDVTITAKTSGRVGFVGSQYSIKQNVPYAWLGKKVYFGCSDVIHNNPEHICTVVVEFRDESGTRIIDPTVITTNDGTKARSFTIPSNTKEFSIMFRIAQNCGTVDVNAGDYVTFKDFYIRYPADTALYEPYLGESVSIEFPATRNLLDTSTHETDTHITRKGITFDYNSDGTLTVNGQVESGATTGPQYRMALWTQQETGNYYLCCGAPYSTVYNEVYVYDTGLSERPRKWDESTASQSAASNRPLSEVHLIAGHTYSINVRINRDQDKTYINDKFYVMLLRSTDTDTHYEPYGTVYCGYVDITRGKLIATHAYMERAIADMDNTDSYPGWTNSAPVSWFGEINKAVNAYTNISTYGGWKIGVNNRYHDPGVLFLVYDHFGLTQTEWKENYPNLIVQFALELANPVEYDLTPQQLKTLKGLNNIWSDANGNVDVKYWTH